MRVESGSQWQLGQRGRHLDVVSVAPELARDPPVPTPQTEDQLTLD
jgi:hypothetical protein